MFEKDIRTSIQRCLLACKIEKKTVSTHFFYCREPSPFLKKEFMKVVRKISFQCVALIVIAWFLFPSGASGITIQEEEELSREFLKVVLKHFELITDPLIVNYANRIGQKIVSIVPHRYYNYRFYVVKEHTFNAFAGPGGHIFINSGLLEVMEDEGELAGILAHEIAHVAAFHMGIPRGLSHAWSATAGS